MTEVIFMAIKLIQDIMATDMCVKFGEDWTNTFPERAQTRYFSSRFFANKGP